MKLEKVLEVTRQAVAQTLGTEYMEQHGYLEAIDVSKLVDIGHDITSGGEGTVEKYTKALISLISRMYFEEREYTSDLPSVFVDNFDWGWFQERIKFDLAEIIDDPMYNLVNGTDYSKIEHTFYQPRTYAKIYEEGKTILVPISITREQVKEAFNGPNELNRFISAIRKHVALTVTVALDAYAHMLVSAGIATSVKATNSAIHLLTEAKEQGIIDNGATLDTALKDENFLAFCVRRINDIRHFMERRTTAFNNGKLALQTPRYDNKMALLTSFESILKANLQTVRFGGMDMTIGDYDSVVSWQAVKSETESFDFETLSSIKISADASNKLQLGTAEIDITYCIGFSYDRMALGVCPLKEYTTGSYTASGDFYNEFNHVLVNYLLDSDYNMVAFMLD